MPTKHCAKYCEKVKVIQIHRSLLSICRDQTSTYITTIMSGDCDTIHEEKEPPYER